MGGEEDFLIVAGGVFFGFDLDEGELAGLSAAGEAVAEMAVGGDGEAFFFGGAVVAEGGDGVVLGDVGEDGADAEGEIGGSGGGGVGGLLGGWGAGGEGEAGGGEGGGEEMRRVRARRWLGMVLLLVPFL